MAPVPEQVGAADGGSRLRKWFDDDDLAGDLDGNSEWSTVKENIQKIKFEAFDSVNDPDLKALIKMLDTCKDRDQQKANVEQLRKYLDKKDREAKEAEQRAEEAKKKHHRQHPRLSRAIEGAKALAKPIMKTFGCLVEILDKTVFIASELTFQTQYEVALKAILLFRTAYQEASGLTEEVVAAFEQIDGYVEEMEFLSGEITSTRLYKAVNRLFVSIVTFIAAAISYLGKRVIVKMAMALGGKNDKFRNLIKSIGAAHEEASRVQTLVGLAVNLTSLRKVESIGKDTMAIQTELQSLDKKVSRLLQEPDSFTKAARWQLQAVYEHTNFQSILHVQNLLAKLFDAPYQPAEELSFNDRERIFLSPKDRWHRQPTGADFWSAYGRSAQITGVGRPDKMGLERLPSALVWVAGRISRRNVSWVSSFSVDLIYHLREFCNVDVAYAFCRRGRGERYVPAVIIKSFICQLLELYPEAAIRNVRFLSEKRFEGIRDCNVPGAALRAWELLEDVLRFIRPTMELRNRRVLVLVDRLDLCTSGRGFSVLRDFIPRLQRLAEQTARVSVMVTAAEVSPMDVHTLNTEQGRLLPYGQRVFHRSTVPVPKNFPELTPTPPDHNYLVVKLRENS
ncbi:hypothetical protein QBC47DRAFT_430486 [Echria macrotheca]|uniref:Uncharacterized protein n=1 Tax=Echria macrotheca TaxID=438768 RepID=A0AAJ0BAB3_9PEZI|nr:hypothetical protein QBC47DRAFT_430486 [Echria macrotheca]